MANQDSSSHVTIKYEAQASVLMGRKTQKVAVDDKHSLQVAGLKGLVTKHAARLKLTADQDEP